MDEAVYLSDQILLLAGLPARVRGEYAVSAKRPRRRGDVWLLELASQITGDLAGEA